MVIKYYKINLLSSLTMNTGTYTCKINYIDIKLRDVITNPWPSSNIGSIAKLPMKSEHASMNWANLFQIMANAGLLSIGL